MYVGQSGRTLKHHLIEHRRALQNGDVTASALAKHVWSTGHLVNLSKAEVIDTHLSVTVSPGKLAHSVPPQHLKP